MSLDPFSLVYNGLWELVDRNEELHNFFPQRNLTRFDEQNAIKDEISDADVPELVLLLGGGNTGRNDTTDSRSVTKNFIWTVTTGDFRVNPVYNKIAFELYRSLIDWECVLCNLNWCNCNFVQNCRITAIEEGTMMENLNRGIEGWAGLWTCEVDMIFPKLSLKIKAKTIG